jgi:hypothetical protein
MPSIFEESESLRKEIEQYLLEHPENTEKVQNKILAITMQYKKSLPQYYDFKRFMADLMEDEQ